MDRKCSLCLASAICHETRFFETVSPICVSTYRTEWYQLQCIRKKISESWKSLMFNNFLKKKILLEVSSRSPRINLQMELSDVEMVLSMSLTELLADNIKSRIEDVMFCNGCIENQANQLGHECVTMNFESRQSLRRLGHPIDGH
ncbi:hypothetical protein AVEN_269203-1 [Araneus ventricosus]|uniref:Uncharacterized protein n=1 Tax=Araneus ventricosus TaxID=182803 RepID=A0A4Y2MY77_ARAVE|nr:hypothetical protein AVEN_269203-1 [Araneus ventricosus]